MSEERKDKMLELLSEKAIFGLSEAELAELAEFEKDFPELNDNSFELAAASIGMLNLDTNEPMPAHLREKVASGAEQFFAARQPKNAAVAEPQTEKEELQKNLRVRAETLDLELARLVDRCRGVHCFGSQYLHDAQRVGAFDAENQ